MGCSQLPGFQLEEVLVCMSVVFPATSYQKLLEVQLSLGL